MGHKATSEDFETATWVLGLLGKQTTAAEFDRSFRLLQRSARQIGRFFEHHDMLLTPTLALPPVAIGSLKPEAGLLRAMKILGRLNAGDLIKRFGKLDESAAQIFKFMPYTPVANVTGQPAMSVPLHWNEADLPIGVQFMGRYGDESTLFRLASAEAATTDGLSGNLPRDGQSQTGRQRGRT